MPRYGHGELPARMPFISAGYQLQIMVKHPDGGMCPVADILAEEEDLWNQINRDAGMGSRKHHRVAPWVRRFPGVALFFDCCLVLFFFAGVTTVDWARPFSARLALAVALGALVTVASYRFLVFTGRRMRSYKSHEGAVHLDEMDGLTRVAFVIAMANIAVLLAPMFIRARTVVAGAFGDGAGVAALVVPLTVAAIGAMTNYLVVIIAARDGSDETARLGKLAVASGRARRLLERAAQQAGR